MIIKIRHIDNGESVAFADSRNMEEVAAIITAIKEKGVYYADEAAWLYYADHQFVLESEAESAYIEILLTESE